jgi:hypothetical protein
MPAPSGPDDQPPVPTEIDADTDAAPDGDVVADAGGRGRWRSLAGRVGAAARAAHAASVPF